jgi:hypothetical protein
VDPRERELAGRKLYRALDRDHRVNGRVHLDCSRPDAAEPVLSTREHSAAVAASTAAREEHRERT